jgi:hypothetical protein
MNRDCAHSADIERRLANLAKAPRCGARTRAGHACKQAAVTGRARCRMHGGAKGSGGPRGDRNGNFKHGLWTADSVETRKAVQLQIQETRRLLQEMNSVLDRNSTARAKPLGFVPYFGDGAPVLSAVEPRGASAADRNGQCSGAAARIAGEAYGSSPASPPSGATAGNVSPDARGRVSISDAPPRGESSGGAAKCLSQMFQTKETLIL